MTSAVRDPSTLADYKSLLHLLSLEFGDSGTSKDLFDLFESISFGKQNLLFTDETKELKEVSQVAGRDTYYTWAGELLSHIWIDD